MIKKLFLSILFGLIAFVAVSQTITKASFRISNKSKTFEFIDLVLNDSILVGLSDSGEIDYIESTQGGEYGIEELEHLGYPVKFYGKFDIHDVPGKLKSIGNIKFAYNNVFDSNEAAGTYKSIGDIQIKYYNVFDIHDPQGKVKSVGKVSVKYYNVFDPNEVFGNIKSISGNTKTLGVFRNRRAYAKTYE